jgi:hypothetical protein
MPTAVYVKDLLDRAQAAGKIRGWVFYTLKIPGGCQVYLAEAEYPDDEVSFKVWDGEPAKVIAAKFHQAANEHCPWLY